MEANFIEALKNGYRYESVRGLITTQDLYSVPLTSKDGFDLDSIARSIYNKIKESEEMSFVSSPTKANKELESKLEIVKFIIADKIADAKAKSEAVAVAAERKRIKDLIADKRLSKESELSLEDLEAKLAALN